MVKSVKNRIRDLRNKIKSSPYQVPTNELKKIEHMIWLLKTQPHSDKDWVKVYLEITKLEVMYLEVLSLWLKSLTEQQTPQDKERGRAYHPPC
jgi:hypothetical protein